MGYYEASKKILATAAERFPFFKNPYQEECETKN